MDIYENKQDYAYNALKRLIITCELKPSEKISRQKLADELHVGNTPIREAILRLEREGLFRTIPQSGTFVTAINKKQVEETIFIRQNIERLVFEEAYEKATKQDIKELEKMLIIQRLAFDSNDFEVINTYDDQFHKYFYEIVDKNFTWTWIDMISSPVKRLIYLQSIDVETSWHETQTSHEKIVQMIKKQLKDEYISLTKKHIENLNPNINFVFNKYPDYFESID